MSSFVAEIAGEDALRVEEDFGDGFVRLKSSEAEKRQAAQDIRSSEDIILELLRNSRDAGSKNIYIAMHKDGDERVMLVLDDGSGIPRSMREKVFQPRVTSKLDSAHLDKWGIHGRGMALFSIKVNSEIAEVFHSEVGCGASIKVVTDTTRTPEKADQSTFPYFEETGGTYSMRGPKNIVRTAAEFAFDSRNDLNVYCGSPTEIASTVYANSLVHVPASSRIFDTPDSSEMKLPDTLALARDEHELADLLSAIGLAISTRSARRILDGEISPLPTLVERMLQESFPKQSTTAGKDDSAEKASSLLDASARPKVSISREDMAEFADAVAEAYSHLAEKYYLAASEPVVAQRAGALQIRIDLVPEDGGAI